MHEVSASNLGDVLVYPDSDFSSISSVPRNCWDDTLDGNHDRLFQGLRIMTLLGSLPVLLDVMPVRHLMQLH